VVTLSKPLMIFLHVGLDIENSVVSWWRVTSQETTHEAMK